MANSIDLQQELLSLVRRQAGEPSLASSPSILTTGRAAEPSDASNFRPLSTDSVGELTRELESLRRQLGVSEEASRRQAEILELNTRAVLDRGSSAGSGAVDAARGAASVVRNTAGLSALSSPIAGLVSWLFRRDGDSSANSELTSGAQSPAAPIDQSLGISSGSGIAPLTYRADGTPRQITQASAAAGPNITVHVQAMDSRSFLDNSDQIASAVREAMLNSHALNDVIGEM